MNRTNFCGHFWVALKFCLFFYFFSLLVVVLKTMQGVAGMQSLELPLFCLGAAPDATRLCTAPPWMHQIMHCAQLLHLQYSFSSPPTATPSLLRPALTGPLHFTCKKCSAGPHCSELECNKLAWLMTAVSASLWSFATATYGMTDDCF